MINSNPTSKSASEVRSSLSSLMRWIIPIRKCRWLLILGKVWRVHDADWRIHFSQQPRLLRYLLRRVAWLHWVQAKEGDHFLIAFSKIAFKIKIHRILFPSEWSFPLSTVKNMTVNQKKDNFFNMISFLQTFRSSLYDATNSVTYSSYDRWFQNGASQKFFDLSFS